MQPEIRFQKYDGIINTFQANNQKFRIYGIQKKSLLREYVIFYYIHNVNTEIKKDFRSFEFNFNSNVAISSLCNFYYKYMCTCIHVGMLTIII